MKGFTSIRSRLRFFLSLCLLLLVGLSAFAILQMVRVNHLVEALDRRHLEGARVLGETADLITEFRFNLAQLALATSAEATVEAIAHAREHSDSIADQLGTYAGLPRNDAELDAFRVFESEWALFSREGFAWVDLPDLDRHESTSDFQQRADVLYRSADDAIDSLITVNTAAADESANTIDRIIARSIFLLSVVAGAAILLVGFAMLDIRKRISVPLAEMTRAMVALAAGDRESVVPQSGRRDEIAELAKVFDIFRANTIALEKAHKAAEEAQRRERALARHDPLTGLTNRRVLAEDLEKVLARAVRFDTKFAVMLIDLDRFKPVNDIHGHAAGDSVLWEVAKRLSGAVRKNDTLSRIGGDEFAIVTEIDKQETDANGAIIKFAERILEVLRAPISVDEGEVQVQIGASIGIAIAPTDGRDSEALLRAADIAMYRAKLADRETFRFYEQSMDQELRARAELEADVRRAITCGDIEPHYQPLIDLKTGAPVGFEVLARWNHPKRGSIPPVEFIPVIEHLGLVGNFTWSMLRRATSEAKTWPGDLQLSVNISPTQLTDPSFPAKVLAILHETSFPPQRLEIEITETALLTDLATVKAILAALQVVGVKVALDDFGTGYSSLYHLRELKLDKIKIDRSFIKSLPGNEESQKIVNGILGLAKSLSLPTTAEGIESDEVCVRMKSLGCDIGQGFLFGKAMPADEVKIWLGGQGDKFEARKSA